ncbi:OadG family transporter subunit [Lachnospiraceae bacterium 29-84]
MKKKILLMISMCLIVLGMAACGADPTTVDYNGYTYEQLKSTCEGTVTSLKDMTDEQKQAYLMMKDMSDVERKNYITSVAPGASEADITEILRQANMIIRWDALQESVGAFQELGKFTITKSGKTLTCEQEIIFENRPVLLTYVYNYHDMALNDITIDEVQSLGEKMTNAALNTLMGMGIVFVVLILISLIISGFKVFPYLEQKAKAKQAAKAPEAPKAPEVAPAPAAPVAAAQDDLELAAVIAAAIAASTGTSTDGFVVRSIKRRY